MENPDTYTVREFARLSGVTVRTLHYYDQIGLLQPTRKQQTAHRLYRRQDLLALQQILTLKYLGFSLEEIGRFLSDPHFNIRRSLSAQQAVVEQKIAQLQMVSRALQQSLEQISDRSTENFDWQLIRQIIQGVTMDEKTQWSQQYYTPEQSEKLAGWANDYTPEQMAAWQQEWADILNGMARLKGGDPASPEAQALAAQGHKLISIFTRGDSGIRSSLNSMYANYDNMPAEYQLVDRETMEFWGKAFEIYEKGLNK